MSFSDLMASTVGVVVLLFAVSVVQNLVQRVDALQRVQAAEAAKLAEEERVAIARRALVVGALEEIRRNVETSEFSSLVEVDVSARRIRLKDATFALGSACVQKVVKVALTQWATTLRKLLEERGDREIQIEGHTDDVPVTVRSMEGRCAFFDDNFTLSSARAREARKVIIDGWPPALALRVTVAGFGDTRPLEGVDHSSATNRRVEIAIREK